MVRNECLEMNAVLPRIWVMKRKQRTLPRARVGRHASEWATVFNRFVDLARQAPYRANHPLASRLRTLNSSEVALFARHRLARISLGTAN